MQMLYDQEYEEYRDRLTKASEDPSIRLALRRAIASYRENVNLTLTRFPQTLTKRKDGRAIKEYSIAHMEELVKQAKDSIIDVKGSSDIVQTPEQLLKRLDELIGTGKWIVKSKSITSEEFEINEHLEATGNKVTETDLGEFILQNLHEKPMHLLTPSIHVPRERVAEMLSKLVGRKLEPDIELLVETARQLLREAYFKADIGMSGANVVTADTGTVFLIENEGNARFVSNAPRTHIAVVGFEKVVPTLTDGMIVSELTWRYASYKAPSYVSLITGVSKTGDIEKMQTYGAHGPKNLHVIFVDNKRTELAKDPVYREALYCTKCGSCLYECPIFGVAAGKFGHKYFGGVGTIWTAFIAGGLEKALPMAYSCTLCGRCKDHCPYEINTPAMIQKLRNELVGRKMTITALDEACKNIERTGNPYGLEAPIEIPE